MWGDVPLRRANTVVRARACCSFFTGCGCQLVQLGDDEDDDDDEGGAVGVPLCRVVRQSREGREL